jgi:hypothetical protein
MLQNLKLHLIYFGIGILIGAFLYARFKPDPIQSLKSDIKKDIIYIDRVIKKKDGTVVEEKIVKQKEETKTENQKHQYRVSAIPNYDLQERKIIYGALIERRMFGDLFMGIYGSSDLNIGVSISLEF